MKKLKIIVPIAVVFIALLLFYIIVLHPRIKIYNDIQKAMDKWDATNLGTAIMPYEYDNQPGEDWIVIDGRKCSFQLPANIIIQPDEIPEYISSNEEVCLTVYEEGHQGVDPLLNLEKYDEETLNQLKDGFVQLGYGIPNSEYSSLKAILSVTDEDYDFWNINKAKAYSVLASHKVYYYAGIYCYTNGVNRVCYYYESEDLYFIVSETYQDYSKTYPYSYNVRFYHPKNLYYVYNMYIATSDPELVFAIINSFQLKY